MWNGVNTIEDTKPATATPHYSDLSMRLDSFKQWARALAQKPQGMAEAGFIYQGIGDRVQCFHCDGALKNWKAEDNAWVEHARWYGDCAYLRQKLGSDFVEWIKYEGTTTEKDELQDKIQEALDRNTAAAAGSVQNRDPFFISKL